MNTLRSISTAVLLSVALTAPAAAATPNISVSVTAASPILVGTAVTYRVSGEGEVRGEYSVHIMPVSATAPAETCYNAGSSTKLVLHSIALGGSMSSLTAFQNEGVIPVEDYPAIGTYVVCATIRNETNTTEHLETFSVTEPPSVVQPAANPSPTPSVAPLLPTPVATPSVVASTSAQKLHAALAKCKKQKNKKKRAKCERAAKKVTR
jgi:hypothetical protein